MLWRLCHVLPLLNRFRAFLITDTAWFNGQVDFCPCTFTLYIPFPLAGWLMHWLLIAKAVPVGIYKYKHSCPSPYLYPPPYCLRVMSCSGLKRRHWTNTRPESSGMTAWKLLKQPVYKHKECSGWLIWANMVMEEESHLTTEFTAN